MNVLDGLLKQVGGVIDRLRASVVSIETGGGFGSGVVWDANGLVVTNDHVMRHRFSQIGTHDGRSVQGQLVARDPHNDLALLKVDADGLIPIEKSSHPLRVGELLIAIGHPLGLRDSAAFGIVNSTESFAEDRELIQADLRLAPGNSGGPIVNADGRLVGIACMVAAPGIALAVPTHLAERLVARSMATQAA
jgi:serine protease Do